MATASPSRCAARWQMVRAPQEALDPVSVSDVAVTGDRSFVVRPAVRRVADVAMRACSDWTDTVGWLGPLLGPMGIILAEFWAGEMGSCYVAQWCFSASQWG
jgi:hypothetical protein